MEWELDDSSLEVLKQAFEWSDYDQDGKISREDLKMSSGLERDEEVEALFLAFKESAGNFSNKDTVSFEEFCKGIIDFPFLLEQFKQDFQATNLSKSPAQADSDGENDIGRYVRELRTYKSQEGNDTDTMIFLYSGLQESIMDFNNALKLPYTSMIPNEAQTPEELMDTLAGLLSKLQIKARQENQSTLWNVSSGCSHLLNLVRDALQYHEDSSKNAKNKLRESQLAFDSLKQHCERLEDSNKILLSQLDELEVESKETRALHSQTLAQKQTLQYRLRQAEQTKEESLNQMEKIKRDISEKEKAISQLEKELRRLNSMKKIQEIRGTIGKAAEDMKKQQGMKDYRQSMPTTKVAPMLSPRNVAKEEVKGFNDTSASKLKSKDERIKRLENELRKANAQEVKLREDLDSVRSENKNLIFRLKEAQLYAQGKRDSVLDEENIEPSSNLYEEMKMIGENCYTEGNVRDSREPPYNPIGISKADTSTQTSENQKIIEPKKEKDRSSCFSCF
ncbi:unnamed protein product [Blepharisma stoltei]|uniref:EF-hand domain-containing protein n=1 Tax=Blepharisma stoltei TaxID=1481888 RepID=A0AAU9JRU3_9CILI|nr:unnamed protein product [Blepharisma stoltei]